MAHFQPYHLSHEVNMKLTLKRLLIVFFIFPFLFTNLVFAGEERTDGKSVFSILYYLPSSHNDVVVPMLEDWKKQHSQSVVIAMADEVLLNNKELLDKVDILCLRQGILENIALSSAVFQNHADKIFNGNVVPTFVSDYQTTVKMVELNSETILYLVNMTYIESIDNLLRRYDLYRLNDFSFLFKILKPNKQNIVVVISNSPLEELNFLLSSSSSLFDILINIITLDKPIKITKNRKTAFHGLAHEQIGVLNLGFTEGKGYYWEWHRLKKQKVNTNSQE
jgi:hypothetical protein